MQQQRLVDQATRILALALVLAVVSFAVYYVIDQQSDTGGGLVERQTATLEEAVRDDPSSFSARLALARAYESSGRNTEALEQYEAALFLTPESTDAALGRGRVQLRLDDIPAAIVSFEEIVENRKDSEFAPVDDLLQEAHYYLGEIFIGQEDYEAAVENLEGAVAIDRTDADAWYMLCAAQVGLGDNSAAVDSCDRAVLMVPDFTEVYEELAIAHENLGQPLDARYAHAMALYSRDEYVKAEEDLRALIVEAPQYWDAYVGLGLALESSQQREAAVEAYRQALVGDPENFLAKLGIVRLEGSPP
jgi:Tfp pilus assembly protein PilF